MIFNRFRGCCLFPGYKLATFFRFFVASTYTVALRAVTTDDFMTADWARIPYDTVATVSARIVNEAPHVNRVVLDVTTKPPASVEYE